MSALEEFDAYVTACNEGGVVLYEDSNQFLTLVQGIVNDLRKALTWEQVEAELRLVLGLADPYEEADNIVHDVHAGLDPEWDARQVIADLDAAQDHRTHP